MNDPFDLPADETPAQQPQEKIDVTRLPKLQQDSNSSSGIPRLNKKIIMIVIIVLIGCVLAGFIFSSFEDKTKTVAQKKSTNVSVPEFDSQLTAGKKATADDPVIPPAELNPYTTDEKAKRETGKVNTRQTNSDTRTTTVKAERSVQDPSLQRLLAEEEAARRAAITIALGHKAEPENTNENLNLPLSRDLSQYENLFAQGTQRTAAPGGSANGPANTQSPGYDYAAANMQDNKGAFYAANKSNAQVLMAAEPAVNLSNMVPAGTIIPAVLITAINSDLPGEILAMVTQQIYSFDGKYILIPQGTKLLANYNANVSWRQKRIQIGWTRLIRPDGISLDLGNMPATDAKGASGSPGSVNNHYLELAGGLGLLAAFTLLSSEIEFQAATLNAPGLVNIADATGNQVNNFGAKYVERVLDIQPTITVKSGQSIYIFINIDLALPVYQN